MKLSRQKAVVFAVASLAFLMVAGVAAAFGNILIPSQEKAVSGCAPGTGGEVCVTVTGTMLNGANGSSHKAWFVKEGYPAVVTIDGVAATSGNLDCTADGDNGTLRVRANVQKAGLAGGGLYVLGARPIRLTCTGLGATIDVSTNAAGLGVTLIPTSARTIDGSGLNNLGQTVYVEVNGTLVDAQNGSSHKAFAVDEGAPAVILVDGVPASSGNLMCQAALGSDNGTLKLRSNVQKAGRAGGGMYVQANSAGRLSCEGQGPLSGASFVID